VSSRRRASLVVALGVAALAGTSLAAMVATSELLVESFGRPVSGRLEPSPPDLSRPDVIQVEPPGRARATVPPGRSRTAAEPPPRRGSGARPTADRGQTSEAAGSVVVAVQRRPARQEQVAARTPVLEEPAAPRPVRPAPERPVRHEPTRPPRHRPCRRPHRHRPHRPHRREGVGSPSAPHPARPGPADPAGNPGGGSPCPDRPSPDHPRHDRHRRAKRDHDQGHHRHRHCHRHHNPDRRAASRG
jgi:hypothetical protein